jgi:peptidoglycan hydrolase CwlO-like protein
MNEDTQAIRKEMKRLEQQIKELTEACDRSEARAKKAEDRARAMKTEVTGMMRL